MELAPSFPDAYSVLGSAIAALRGREGASKVAAFRLAKAEKLQAHWGS